MSKAIITFGTGAHAELLSIARPSYQAFAKRHGYDYFEADRIGHQRPPAWYKVTCLIELLKSYDVAAFFGADLVVVDGREDFPLDGDWWQAMVVHNTKCGMVPNDDMWIVNQNMIQLLEKVWALDKYLNHGWWEQAALLDVMGYEHLQVSEFPIKVADVENELLRHTRWLDSGWNVHCWDTPQPTRQRIQHATMWPDRAAIMQKWAEKAQGWIDGN
jgi:hypothetical protein